MRAQLRTWPFQQISQQKPVLKTSKVGPNSLFTYLKERVKCDLKRLKNRLLAPNCPPPTLTAQPPLHSHCPPPRHPSSETNGSYSPVGSCVSYFEVYIFSPTGGLGGVGGGEACVGCGLPVLGRRVFLYRPCVRPWSVSYCEGAFMRSTTRQVYAPCASWKLFKRSPILLEIVGIAFQTLSPLEKQELYSLERRPLW